jgi:antitoxin component YwqK of YwqJK toxin-antitoxin module
MLGNGYRGDMDRMKSVSRIVSEGVTLIAIAIASATGGSKAFSAEGDKPATAPAASPKPSDDRPVGTVEDRVKIKPYTGPPILLDEAEKVAAPTIVNRETAREKYENGKPRIEREIAKYSDNHFEADGVYREYYPSGQLFVEGQFKKGRQDGTWTYWYENGKENRKAIYKDGQPHGTWEVHRADETLSAKRGFQEGLRDGEWIVYDEKGEKPLREEHYDKGKKDGVWKVWFPSGKQRQEVSFKQNKRDGKSIEWGEDGNKRAEIPYIDDKPSGTATAWLPDGRTIVQEFKDGKLVSEAKQ